MPPALSAKPDAAVPAAADAAAASDAAALRRWQEAIVTGRVSRVVDEETIAAVCAIDDPIDAAEALLSRLAVVHRVFRSQPSTLTGIPIGAAFLLGHPGDQHSWLTLYADDLRDWGFAAGMVAEDRLARRRDRLDVVLVLGSAPAPLASALGDPASALKVTPERTSKLAAVLDVWWQARMGEGHTPESARLLLSLLLDPENAARVVYDDTGCPQAVPRPPHCDQPRLT